MVKGGGASFVLFWVKFFTSKTTILCLKLGCSGRPVSIKKENPAAATRKEKNCKTPFELSFVKLEGLRAILRADKQLWRAPVAATADS